MEKVLTMKNVCKTYKTGHDKPVEALKDINMEFEKGVFYGIMGPSGAGKSTLLSILGCMDTYTKGEMYIGDALIDNMSKKEMAKIRMKKIGFVFQNFFLNKNLTVEENIVLAMKINKEINKKDYEKRVDELLSQFDVLKYKKSYPDKLSGGEQQRVCIARALANNPDIVLADEPTGNLDQDNEKVVLEYLKGLKELGKTIIMVSHSEVVKKYADKMIFVREGSLVEKL